MKYPLTCQQTGRFGSNTVTAPIFAVRNGENGQIDTIRPDNSRYGFFTGKLNKTGSLPHQKFYLIIGEITMEDNDKQFVCIKENEVAYVEESFSTFNTTIIVPSEEGKELGPTFVTII